MNHKTLEDQIKDLWKSRNLSVIEITVSNVGKDRFQWTVVAEPPAEEREILYWLEPEEVTILDAAIDGGYYETPKRITLDELAEELAFNDPTILSDKMHIINKKVTQRFIKTMLTPLVAPESEKEVSEIPVDRRVFSAYHPQYEDRKNPCPTCGSERCPVCEGSLDDIGCIQCGLYRSAETAPCPSCGRTPQPRLSDDGRSCIFCGKEILKRMGKKEDDE